MCIESLKSPHTDAGLIRTYSAEAHQLASEQGIIKKSVPQAIWATHRGVISVVGTMNPWGLRWQLASESIVFRVESNWTNEYIDEMEPWVHYVPVKADFSDLVELSRLVALQAGEAVLVDGCNITLQALELMTRNARELIDRFSWESDVSRIALRLSDIWRPGQEGAT